MKASTKGQVTTLLKVRETLRIVPGNAGALLADRS